MSTVPTTTFTAKRLGYAVLAVALGAAAVYEAVKHGTGYWQLGVFAIAPDVPLLFGAGSGLEKGQLHPRAVPAYNAVHRFWGPVALGAVAAFGLIPPGYLVGALAWGFHVSLDRAVGYGLRTRDGHQRS
jgi:hypothetical protein